MCGISGYFGQGNTRLLEQMANALSHRGPDGQGLWENRQARVGFAHRRLSIVDLSDAGKQPMTSIDGRVTLCYNGELYNFSTHRDKLKKLGYRFRGHSDTEVVLNLYHHFGIEFLDHVNGIFSLAIWDSATRELLLVRDNMGVKPLYYRQCSAGFYFASEIRALLLTQDQKPGICLDALEAYLDFLYVPGELTLFEGIKKLEPGTCATIKDGHMRIRRWFHPTFNPDFSVAESEWVERMANEFDAAVERQMVADVTVGAFLSGGIDSSAIVSAACRHIDPGDLRCFTISYPESDIASEGLQSDLPYARYVAKQLGVDLHETVVGPDAIDQLPRVVAAMEEPDADMTAIVTQLISRSAKQAGATVLLSGTGGDEVFYGYRTHLAYRHFAHIPQFLQPAISNLLAVGKSIALPVFGAASPIIRRADRYSQAMPLRGVDRHLAITNNSGANNIGSILTNSFRDSLPTSHYLRQVFNRYAQTLHPDCEEASVHTWLLEQTFLADHNFLYADKCGMANSIEIRVPFMDRQLMELASQIPSTVHMAKGVTKNVLRKIMKGSLDAKILNRPKVGFNPPIRTWIAQERSELSRDLLSVEVLKNRGFFDPMAVKTLRHATKAGHTDGAQLLFAMQILELWCQEFIDQKAA